MRQNDVLGGATGCRMLHTGQPRRTFRELAIHVLANTLLAAESLQKNALDWVTPS
jgi:hypothetical protein